MAQYLLGVMSTAPVEIRPWRECPFTRGRRYRVRQSFAALRDSFTAGDILTRMVSNVSDLLRALSAMRQQLVQRDVRREWNMPGLSCRLRDDGGH